MSFEKNLERVAKITEQIEDSETPLEEAISLYKYGISLAKECGEILQGYEEEVMVLQKTADSFTLAPFETAEVY
jgi:exodeoxyribonuclease VII small subunit